MIWNLESKQSSRGIFIQNMVSIALDAKIFSEIVRKLPDNEIIIDNRCIIIRRLSPVKKQSFNIAGQVRRVILLTFRILKKMNSSQFHSLH